MKTTKLCLKFSFLSVLLIGMSGCGTSHLNCDKADNQDRLKQAINAVVDDYLQANLDSARPENAFPTIDIVSFNQHIIDINAKKCDYRVHASFQDSGNVLRDILVSVVFRSTGTGGQTHELNEFTIDPSDAVRLGIAAVKNAETANKDQ